MGLLDPALEVADFIMHARRQDGFAPNFAAVFDGRPSCRKNPRERLLMIGTIWAHFQF
jgi:hypothetical protein